MASRNPMPALPECPHEPDSDNCVTATTAAGPIQTGRQVVFPTIWLFRRKTTYCPTLSSRIKPAKQNPISAKTSAKKTDTTSRKQGVVGCCCPTGRIGWPLPERGKEKDAGEKASRSRHRPIVDGGATTISLPPTGALADAPMASQATGHASTCRCQAAADAVSMPCRSMKRTTSSSPACSFRLHITNGRSPRILRASLAITSSEAPT